MGLLFDPAEVFQIAVRIEVNGEKFYREMAKKLDDPEVVSLFSYLADEEIGHREFYEALLSQIESVEPEEDYPGEYFDYLYSYADGIIFSQEAFEKKLQEIDSAEDAIEFAIGVEWDSIHFYQELKGLVPAHHRDRLDKLIAEERRHFVQLTKIRKRKN